MKRYVLSIAHADARQPAGGMAKHIREEAAAAAERGVGMATVFPLSVLQCPRMQGWASRGWGVCRDGRWMGMRDWRGVLELLGRWERDGWALAEIQLHHIGGYDPVDLRRFLAAVPARTRLFLHDYHTVCPSAHLMRNGREHCGTSVPGERKCHGCRYWNPAWLPKMKETLGGLGNSLRVTAPSESVRDGWLHSWPEFRGRVDVIPHWVASRTVRGTGRNPGQRLKIAFAGAQLGHKGWPVWKHVVETLSEGGANHEFLYFGLGRDIPRGARAVAVGDGGMTGALRREQVDFLVLWSVWPETYSYVYYEAVQAGTWVLAPEVSGNIADAIRKGGWGTLFRTEGDLLAFLGDEARARKTLEQARAVERPAAMVVNPRVIDELPDARPLGLPCGRARRAWAHEAVWKLKEWTGHA